VIFSLDVRRARKGDCFILHYGSEDDPGLILIDGGPSNVYKPYLKPRLHQIKKARGLDKLSSLSIDILMISHIDDDHIKGLLELTKELVTAKDARQPLPFKINSLWHNTFDDIIGNKPSELLASIKATFGAASLTGDIYSEDFDPQAAMVLSSVGQGIDMRDDARKLKIPFNPEFDGQLVMATKDGGKINPGKGLKMTVVGPMKKELLELQKEHDRFLKRKKKERKKKEALASFTDKSAANLSSIVVLAEVGEKRILFTGDARGDKILEGLELVGLLKKNGKIHVDVLKVPHHGSDRNIDPILFRRITADHYVFSGNGEHGNPERRTLQMLLDECGDRDFTMHLTYPIDEMDEARKIDWNNAQQEEKRKKAEGKQVTVRKNWSPKNHSLKAFFTANKEFAKKVIIVEDDAPYVIDLLDEVGF